MKTIYAIRALTGLGALLAWWTSSVLLSSIPAYTVEVLQWRKYYWPSQRRLTGLLRLFLFTMTIHAWCAAILTLVSFIPLVPKWLPAFSAYVFFFLLSINGGSEFRPAVGAMFQLFYDPPSLFLVFLFDRLNYRYNSLFTRIQERLLLGSIPFPRNVAALAREGVTHVVNMEKEYAGPL